MKITETKEVIKTQIEEVLIGRKCDICGKAIEKHKNLCDQYNYFVIHTWHNDWENDSIDSHEYLDACSDVCALKYASEYIHIELMINQ